MLFWQNMMRGTLRSAGEVEVVRFGFLKICGDFDMASF